jgi:LPS-assembly protein
VGLSLQSYRLQPFSSSLGLLALGRVVCSPVNVIRRLLPLLFFTAAVILRGATALVDVTGQHTDTDLTNGETVVRGSARLAYEDIILLADEIHYNLKTDVVVARGNVALTRGTQRLLADEITYHLNSHAYSVKGPRLGDTLLYVSGSELTGDRTSMMVNDARLSYGEPGPWTPTLDASLLTYVPGQTIRAEHATLGLGGWQFLSVPAYNQSVNDPLFAALTLSGGYRSTLGVFADANLLAPVGPDLKLGGDLGAYSGRGVMVGPGAALKFDQPGLSFDDTLRTGFIRDEGNRLTDILNRPIPADRAFVEWDHRAQIGENITTFGQLNYWSDSDVIRDFHPDQFYPVQTPDTFLEADYTGVNSVLSGFVRAQPDPYFAMQQRLPELRFDQLPTAIGGGFYETFSASAADLEDDAVGSTPAVTSHRFDAVYEITRPFTPFEWLSVTPVVGGRLTYYADATNGESTYTRALGEVGFDASLRSSAVYNYTNPAQDIDGLRHLVTPTLSYRYIPAATSGTPYIPPVDTQAYSTYLQPLGLSEMRNIDQISPTNTLRWGVNNTLQTRDPHYGSRDLATLNLAVDWRLTRLAGQRPFSPVQAEGALMPAPWLRADAFTRVDPLTGGLRELNSGVTVHDGEAWSVRVGQHYLDHQLKEYVLDATYRIDEARELVTRIHYDAQLNRFDEEDYGFRATYANVWRVLYLVVLHQGPNRDGSFGFNIEAELKKF